LARYQVTRSTRPSRAGWALPCRACPGRKAVHDRPDTAASVEDAAVELLGCYALGDGVAALTQGNLKILDCKCKAALAGGSGMPGTHKFDRVRSIGIAAQANASGHGGDGRNRYDAVAYESYAQYLTGNDADADTRTLLQTNLSSVRRVFFGKPAPMSITLLARAGTLTPHFRIYAAHRIASPEVRAAGAYDDIILSEASARSLLDGSAFLDIQRLVAPLVELECIPIDEFGRLSREGGIPSHDAVICMFQAYRCLFADLGYGNFQDFYDNLLAFRKFIAKAHSRLTGNFTSFIKIDLRNIRESVRSSFDSPSHDNKVCVAFGCDAAIAGMGHAEEAMKAIERDVILGLTDLKRPGAAAAPSADLPSRKACKQPAAGLPKDAPAARPAATTGAPSGAGASKPRKPPNVEVTDKEVITNLFKYDKQVLASRYGCPADQCCFAVLLRKGCSDADCPMQGAPGHEPGGICHDTNGVDPKDIPCKRRNDGAVTPFRKLHFAKPAWK
jgi:hypothetical protein